MRQERVQEARAILHRTVEEISAVMQAGFVEDKGREMPKMIADGFEDLLTVALEEALRQSVIGMIDVLRTTRAELEAKAQAAADE